MLKDPFSHLKIPKSWPSLLDVVLTAAACISGHQINAVLVIKCVESELLKPFANVFLSYHS